MKKGKGGDVIHVDFGGPALPSYGASCEVLYADGEVVLTRTELTHGGEAWVTHGLYPARADD